MMQRIVIQALQQLGCNDKQIRLYKAASEVPSATIPELAKLAHVQRSTAYIAVAELVEHGLLNEDLRSYRNRFIAVEPVVLLRKLEARQRRMGRLNLAFKEVLPELQAAYQTSEIRPRVRTYEGRQGVIAMRQDILAVRQEILLWTNQASEKHIFDYGTHQVFISERMAKQIPIRVLAIDNPDGRTLRAGDATHLRETRLLARDMRFTSETYIYGDKVAVSDVGRNIFGVITENAQIAASQRAVFELAWRVSGNDDGEV